MTLSQFHQPLILWNIFLWSTS